MANPSVELYVMDGCGACQEFWPRFKQIAGLFYNVGLPIQVYNVGRSQARAQAAQIQYTPTVVIRDRAGAVKKLEGAVSSVDLKLALAEAMR